jgi:hypothetical protein
VLPKTARDVRDKRGALRWSGEPAISNITRIG